MWPATAKLLRSLIEQQRASEPDPANALLFTNARGQQLSRFGVRYLLRKYVALASKTTPTLREKRIHPHSLRHGTAVALLKSGVDFATISQWMGHASLNTTMRYARGDTITSTCLEESQEAHDTVCRKVPDLKLLHAAICVSRRKLQQQHDAVAVAPDGMWTHASLPREVILEKPHDARAELARTLGFHDQSPPIVGPYERSKRLLAWAITAGMWRR